MRSLLIIFIVHCSTFSFVQSQTDTSFYPNGNIDSIVNISENILIHYYASGQIKSIEPINYLSYKDFQKKKEWYSNGKIKFQILSSDTSQGIIDCHYFENGNFMQIEYSRFIIIEHDTLPEFCFGKKWCENGTLISAEIKMCSDEIQQYILHHCNGEIKIKSKWCKGRLVGDYFEFYENGKIKVEGKYKDFNISSEIENWDPGVSREYKVGVWKFYSPSGKLDHIETYDANHNLIMR